MSYDFPRLTDEDEEPVEDVSGFGTSTYDALAREFQIFYRFLFEGRQWTEEFQTKLSKAGMSTTANLWLSGAFAIGLISGGVAAITVLLLGVAGILPLFVPSVGLDWLPVSQQYISALDPVAFALGVFFWASGGALGGVLIGGAIAISWPSLRIRQRRREIGLIFPDAISFMEALAVSGMGRFEVFEAVADSEDVYGEVSVEFQRIVNQVKYTDIDFQAAVEDVANSCANEELAEFLTSLLSTINAGGSLKEELQEQQQIARRQRKQQLETVVDYLQMAGQAYMALMIAPILLVMLLTITALTGDAQIGVLLGVVYGVGPLINILFFLMVSSIKQDEVGRGYIRLDDGTIPNKSISNPFNFGAIEDYYSKHKSFRRTYRKEVQRTLWGYVTSPLSFFIDHPQFLFIVTAPATILGIAGLIAMDIITLSIDGFIQQPMQQTIGWMVWPAFANLLPFSLAYEWRARKRSAVTDSLSSDLRALANTNSHGKPLPDCLKITAEDQSGKLADEFGNIYKKLQMGIPLGTGIAEFNNKYQIPRLARMMKIVDQSREVSTNISDVLSTAADTAEFQAEIVEKRNAKMKVQVIIVEGAFLIFLGLLVSMDTAFIDFATDIIGDAEALRQGGESADPRLLSVLLIHTALIQGFSSGFLAGYFKTSEIGRGAKYALFNIALVLLAWAVAPTLLQYVSL